MTQLSWPPRSFVGQNLANTVGVLLAAQIFTMLFVGLFLLKPQAERVAGIVAQSFAAVSDAADLSNPTARAAIIARLDASPYIDIWPGDTAPPPSGPPPRFLERIFLQAFVDALANRGELLWRTDAQRRLWIQARIGADHYWISARSPTALHPIAVITTSAATAFLLGLVALVALQRQLMRPLEDLTSAVQAFGPHTAPQLVSERGPVELVTLSRGFNAMTARLTAADAERALLLAGVSHDLRTPLAKLRLAVELLAPEDNTLARAAHGHVAELDRVVAQFLMFARGFEAEPETRFDVDALISEIIAMQAAEGRVFLLAGHGIGDIRGRPESLRRALVNLTENAVKYGAPTFEIGADRREGFIELFVRDAGPGAPEDRLVHLSRPFTRGEAHTDARPGAGLGLAIVERVAILHGGTLALANLTPRGFESRLSIAEKE